MQKAQNLLVVVQRLADAHEHNVGDPLPNVPLGGVHLGRDFARHQVAHPARLGGGAEPAAHAAAHLGRHAHRVAIVVAHHHRFDAVAVRQLEQILHCTVLGLLTTADLRRRDEPVLLQLGQQGLGLVGHLGKGRHLLLVQPMKNLLGPKGRLAHFANHAAQFFQAQG